MNLKKQKEREKNQIVLIHFLWIRNERKWYSSVIFNFGIIVRNNNYIVNEYCVNLIDIVSLNSPMIESKWG